MIERTRLSTCVLLCVVVGIAVGTGVATAAGVDHATASTATALNDGNVLYSHTASGEISVDGHLESGGLYWQGQTVGFNDSAGVLTASQLYLREYATVDNELGAVVRGIELDDGMTTLETDGLDGTYVLTLTDQRDTVVEFDNGAVAGTVDVERAAAFEVEQQTLDIRWEAGRSETVETDRELEINSNRVRYNLNVTSPTLGSEQLRQVFMGNRELRANNRPFVDRNPFGEGSQMHNTYAEENVIVLRGFGDGALETDFGRIETFPESIVIEVTDTGLRRNVASPSNALESGPMTISQLDVTDSVDTGDPVELSATLTNEWSTTQPTAVSFELGATGSSVETTLDGGEETTVTATLPAPSEPGEVDYVVTVDGDRVEGIVTVRGSTSEGDSSDSSDDGESDSGGIFSTLIGLLYPQGLIGLIMTALAGATFVVWRRQ